MTSLPSELRVRAPRAWLRGHGWPSGGKVTRRHVAVAGLALACPVAALAGSDMAGGAWRAMAVLALLAAGAVAVRRGGSVCGPAPRITVLERQVLARDVGIALVTVEERRLVLGYGPGGVGVVAELLSRAPGPRP